MGALSIPGEPWAVLSPLVIGALALVAWDLLWPERSADLVAYVVAGGVALAFAAALNPVLAPAGGQSVDRLGALLRLFVLTGGALALTVDGAGTSPSRVRPRMRGALLLLALTGGILALSSAHLGAAWVGVALCTLSVELARQERWEPTEAVSAQALGAVFMLLGLGLLYGAAGTLDLGRLGHLLWISSGPRPAMLYAGLALTVAGLGAALGLLPPYGHHAFASLVGPSLGVALIVRLALQGSAALAWEWFWMLHVLGLVPIGWALGRAIRRGERLARLQGLMVAQRGLLLWSLALAFTSVGLEPLSLIWAGFLLAQTLILLCLQRMRVAQASGQSAPLVGAVRHSPWVGIPLLVGLASMAALPVTLGATGRARMILAASEHFPRWVAWGSFAVSAGLALLHLTTVLAMLRRGSKLSAVSAPRWIAILLAFLAVALIALGALPWPLQQAAAWGLGAR